jgi:hypothetical protein
LKECIELSEGLHSEKRHVEQFVSHEIWKFVDDVSSSAHFCFDTGNAKKCEVAKGLASHVVIILCSAAKQFLKCQYQIRSE